MSPSVGQGSQPEQGIRWYAGDPHTGAVEDHLSWVEVDGQVANPFTIQSEERDAGAQDGGAVPVGYPDIAPIEPQRAGWGRGGEGW